MKLKELRNCLEGQIKLTAIDEHKDNGVRDIVFTGFSGFYPYFDYEVENITAIVETRLSSCGDDLSVRALLDIRVVKVV